MKLMEGKGSGGYKFLPLAVLAVVIAAGLIVFFALPTTPLVQLTQSPFGSSVPPVGTSEAPPNTVMIYNGQEYPGKFVSSTSEVQESFADVPDTETEVTSVVPEEAIRVRSGDEVQFVIRGNPPSEAQSDSLSVNAYTNEGEPVKILNYVDESKRTTFGLDLNPGGYILQTVSLWLSDNETEQVTGYVIHSYRINVTG